MPEFEIIAWGNNNIGKTWKELRGQFGVILLASISGITIDSSTGNLMTDQIKLWEDIIIDAKNKYIKHGIYFQVLVNDNKFKESDLNKTTKLLKITLPLGLVSTDLWNKLGLHNSGNLTPDYLLIDPYGRIATRLSEQEIINDYQCFTDFKALPYAQMEREVAEYWLETKAEDIVKADKYFKKKKKRYEAYKIYQPLAEKVKAIEAGKVIFDRVEEIENEVRDSILKSLMNLTPENIGKSMAPMKKTMREFKDTILADEAARQLAVLKRTKKDSELLDLIRLNVANTFTRLGRKEDARAIYESLTEQYKEDEGIQAELSLRIAGKVQLAKKQVLDCKCKPEEWLEKAEGFFAEAETLLASENINRENATALLLAAAEHYTAGITNSASELPGLRERLKAARTKLFWIASQE
ncbi:tol-pal system YbgF family protein [Planctomycetota bacterium]